MGKEPEMRITGYHCFTLSTGWRNLTYLIVTTDEGVTGVGEAHVVGKTHTVREYLKEIKRHIVGHDVFDIESLYEKLTLLDFGAPGQVVMTGLGLLEMACWDCIGRKARLPVYKLIGGAVREKILAYANGWYKVERTPEKFHEAAGRVLERGYRAMKFDPFGNGNLELTREEFSCSIGLIEAVHSAVEGKAQMFIEMHGRFAPHQAVEIARAIERFEPGWLEEPCRPTDVEALRYVMQHTCIPIATGERLYGAPAYNELFRGRLANIVQPDISQCGGMLEVKKIASTAETHSMMVSLHNVGGIIATTACVHLMATLRNGKILEHFNDFSDQYVKQAGTPYPEVVDGHFRLPEGHGWGVEMDIEFLERQKPAMEDGVILDPGLNMFRTSDWNKRERS
jgi:galactonate dehydratase